MNKLYLTLTLLLISHATQCMDGDGTVVNASANKMLLREEHNKRRTDLQRQIDEVDQKIREKKLAQAKEIISINRKWDLKTAATPLFYSVLIGGKTAYDVYTLLNTPEVPQWLDISNLVIDSAMLTWCLGKGSWHLVRACCRSAKEE